jgi:hypothetical protein
MGKTTGLWLAPLALAIGCTGSLDDGPFSTHREASPPPAPLCDAAEVGPSGSALRRLTPTEYRNTVRDLFPGVSIPDVTLAADLVVGGFDNSAEGQTVSPLLTENYQRAGVTIGAAVTADLARWAPCTTNDAACAAQITELVAMRAQRRPLTSDERALFVGLVEATRVESGLADAVAALVEALLMTPQFLYRPELGAVGRAAPAGLVALDDYELASRLSYFLWRSMPDTTLFDAAAAGELADPALLEGHARRMLEDPRAHATIADLHAQWFQVARVDALTLDRTVFPELDRETQTDMRDSLARYLDDAFWQDGTVSALFSGHFGYVNDRLAPLFGIPAPGSTELVRVELDETQRSGILTQPGWLAERAHPTVHSPVYRGVFVLEHVLCAPTLPAPPGAEAMTMPLPEGTVVTTRERVSRSHTGYCASCHARIDGVGFAFENFDALGRYRETEVGMPIDATGEILGAGDANGPISGAVDLADRLGTSHQVESCVADHYLRYALGRSLVGRGDTCQVDALRQRLEASGGDLSELVVGIVTSPNFIYRTAVTP